MRSNRKILSGALLLAGVAIFAVLYLSLSNISRRLATSRQVSAPQPVSLGRSGQSAPGSGLIYEAATDIPVGSLITREMLQAHSGEMPSSEAYITNPEAQALGFITRVKIARGSLIRPADDFVGHISETGIAGALRPGTRALVLSLANKATLHDLVRIGNSVDVLAAFDGQESRSIVQNVRVLAVDVFGQDYPQVNAAMRGPYKAEPRGRGIASTPGAPAAGQVGPPSETAPNPNAPSETPTAQPTVAPNTPRPEAALTLEVTPTQAARIQLAIASNAALDYLVRPALPGNRSIEPGDLIAGAEGEGGTESGLGSSSTNAVLVRPVSVTRAQIAPYAERKKAGSGGSSSSSSSNSGGSNRGSGSNSGSGDSAPSRSARGFSGGSGLPIRVNNLPPLSTRIDSLPPADLSTGGGRGGNNLPSFPGQRDGNSLSLPREIAPSAPSSYKIPIYADGRIVRREEVLTPREP